MSATRKGKILSQIYEFLSKGWSGTNDSYPENQRIVHTTRLYNAGFKSDYTSLDESPKIHCGYLGIFKMKSMTKSYIWWPNLELITKNCSGCQACRHNLFETHIYAWNYPQCPRGRLHCDSVRLFWGHMYFVVVDTISFESLFFDYGVCGELVSDYGPQFVSEEFHQFLQKMV